MLFACWVTRATDTHSEYILLHPSSRQQSLTGSPFNCTFICTCISCWVFDLVCDEEKVTCHLSAIASNYLLPFNIVNDGAIHFIKQALLLSLSISNVCPFECCYYGIWLQSTIVAYFTYSWRFAQSRHSIHWNKCSLIWWNTWPNNWHLR